MWIRRRTNPFPRAIRRRPIEVLSSKPEMRLGDVGDAAGEVGLARGDDEMVAGVGDAGREDDVAQVHPVLERPCEVGVRLDKRPVVAVKHMRSEEDTSEIQPLMRLTYADLF